VSLGDGLFDRCAAGFMSVSPIMVALVIRVEDALSLMKSHRVGALLVGYGSDVVRVFKKQVHTAPATHAQRAQRPAWVSCRV
jgi:hypothetical protein